MQTQGNVYINSLYFNRNVIMQTQGNVYMTLFYFYRDKVHTAEPKEMFVWLCLISTGMFYKCKHKEMFKWLCFISTEIKCTLPNTRKCFTWLCFNSTGMFYTMQTQGNVYMDLFYFSTSTEIKCTLLHEIISKIVIYMCNLLRPKVV